MIPRACERVRSDKLARSRRAPHGATRSRAPLGTLSRRTRSLRRDPPVTSSARRPRIRTPSSRAVRSQSQYWNGRYRSDPALFGSGESPFLQWVLSQLTHRPHGRNWIELGSGYGRDLRALHARGYRVRGIDVSAVGVSLARESGLHAVRAPALRFLEKVAPASVDVVFSNLFWNMEFSENDHERLFSRVHRVLGPGGFHAYSVRSVTDRWYGKGVPVGPDMFDLTPDGPVMHFFSREYARRLRGARFRCVRAWECTEDPGGFPTRVLYVLEQKVSTGHARE